jgi:hypothetical protein
MQSQHEIDFVRWLRELSCDVVVRYGRYFETNNGEYDDNDYCKACVQIERWKRRHDKNPFIKIGGWDDAITSDSTRFCDRCGCMLELSPTEYLTDQYLEYLPECETLSAEFAWELQNWLTGMGDYDRAKHWPQIKPHAERFMVAAGLDIVPDGVIRYVPAEDNWYPHDTIWLSIYHYLAKRLVSWIKETGLGEQGFLVDSSGCSIRYFQSITKPEEARTCVERLLEHVGGDCDRGRFLASLGLSSHQSLEQAIFIPDGRCHLPTFDVRGRVFKKSPNKFHPDAVVVTHAKLILSADAKQWHYLMFYDYKHFENSSWCVEFRQDGRSLPEFCEAVTAWQNELLIAVGPEDQWRHHRLKQWDRVRAALGEVFYFEAGDGELCERLTDALMAVDGSSMTQHRIHFTGSVRRTMFRWAEKTVASKRERKSKK